MEIDEIGVKVRLYEPVDRKGRIRAGIVYFHGGGFMYGDISKCISICNSMPDNSQEFLTIIDILYNICQRCSKYRVSQKEGYRNIES